MLKIDSELMFFESNRLKMINCASYFSDFLFLSLSFFISVFSPPPLFLSLCLHLFHALSLSLYFSLTFIFPFFHRVLAVWYSPSLRFQKTCLLIMQPETNTKMKFEYHPQIFRSPPVFHLWNDYCYLYCEKTIDLIAFRRGPYCIQNPNCILNDQSNRAFT